MDRSTFTQKAKTRVDAYHIESLGEDVYLRSITLKERNKLLKMGANGDLQKAIAEDADFFQWLIATSLCDQNGNQLFDPNKIADKAEIAGIDSAVADEIANAIFKHSKLGENDAKDTEKNSPASL